MTEETADNPHGAGYEKRDVNVIGLALATLATVGVVIGIWVMMDWLYVTEREALLKRHAREAKNPKLLELRAEETQILSSYGYDKQKGTYRIPIDKAMKLLVEEEFQKRRAQ